MELDELYWLVEIWAEESGKEHLIDDIFSALDVLELKLAKRRADSVDERNNSAVRLVRIK